MWPYFPTRSQQKKSVDVTKRNPLVWLFLRRFQLVRLTPQFTNQKRCGHLGSIWLTIIGMDLCSKFRSNRWPVGKAKFDVSGLVAEGFCPISYSAVFLINSCCYPSIIPVSLTKAMGTLSSRILTNNLQKRRFSIVHCFQNFQRFCRDWAKFFGIRQTWSCPWWLSGFLKNGSEKSVSLSVYGLELAQSRLGLIFRFVLRANIIKERSPWPIKRRHVACDPVICHH